MSSNPSDDTRNPADSQTQTTDQADAVSRWARSAANLWYAVACFSSSALSFGSFTSAAMASHTVMNGRAGLPLRGVHR